MLNIARQSKMNHLQFIQIQCENNSEEKAKYILISRIAQQQDRNMDHLSLTLQSWSVQLEGEVSKCRKSSRNQINCVSRKFVWMLSG